MEGADLKD